MNKLACLVRGHRKVWVQVPRRDIDAAYEARRAAMVQGKRPLPKVDLGHHECGRCGKLL